MWASRIHIDRRGLVVLGLGGEFERVINSPSFDEFKPGLSDYSIGRNASAIGNFDINTYALPTHRIVINVFNEIADVQSGSKSFPLDVDLFTCRLGSFSCFPCLPKYERTRCSSDDNQPSIWPFQGCVPVAGLCWSFGWCLLGAIVGIVGIHRNGGGVAAIGYVLFIARSCIWLTGRHECERQDEEYTGYIFQHNIAMLSRVRQQHNRIERSATPTAIGLQFKGTPKRSQERFGIDSGVLR